MSGQKILDGELTLDHFKKEKSKNRIIQNTDAVLILNFDKNEIKNYIGGNTFLEIGFAYVLDKPIYFINPILDMLYTDEIQAMQPKIFNGDLRKIKR